MTKNEKDYIKRWLEIAEHDWDAAQTITDEKGTIIKFSLPKKIVSSAKPTQKTLDL